MPEEKASFLDTYREATDQAMGSLGVDDIQSLVVVGPEEDWLMKHVRRLSGLAELVFRPFCGAIGDQAVAFLHELGNLRRLDVSRSSITDDALPSIATMKSLTALDLSRTGVLGNKLDVLRDLHIQELDLDGLRISTTGWQHLGRFHSLRRLSWNWAMSRRDGLRRLAESSDDAVGKDLLEPFIWNSSIADADLAVLAELPDVRFISMRHAPITDEGVSNLCRLRQLTTLDVSGTEITDACAVKLAGLPDIREISLSYTKMTIKTVAELSRCESIRELVMDQTEVGDEAGPYLSRMSQLESLSIRPALSVLPTALRREAALSDPGITDAGYACLLSMGSLKKLNLTGATITDRTLEYLDAHQSLEELYASDTDVTGEGLERMPELRCLLLGGTMVTDDALRKIAAYGHLERLSLADTPVTDAGLANLVGLSEIRSLGLAGTSITGAGIRLLREMPTLREVALQSVPLTSDDLCILAGLPKLQTLRLNMGELSATDIMTLAESGSLRTLYLSGSSVSVDLTRYIEQAMAQCRVMRG